MCKSPLHSFLLNLPKCEHHIHLEGALTPELVFSLARKNKISLPDLPHYQSPEALAARYDGFDNLDDFLNIHYANMSVLITEDDFYELAWSYVLAAHADGVHHAEVFFDPQSHTPPWCSYSISHQRL
ncbi:adenosine deaminase [Penicillium waksmanii]|uniref:adenosine deaminase n=1 Tax=Penicillium waksmanii TaxID=69791 RepID=UPI0025478567|nr:adenosine deaminase [Penicillium waksmanii]KAJ5963140.1 adenosine deaminase [Penicillium waksmanii]